MADDVAGLFEEWIGKFRDAQDKQLLQFQAAFQQQLQCRFENGAVAAKDDLCIAPRSARLRTDASPMPEPDSSQIDLKHPAPVEVKKSTASEFEESIEEIPLPGNTCCNSETENTGSRPSDQQVDKNSTPSGSRNPRFYREKSMSQASGISSWSQSTESVRRSSKDKCHPSNMHGRRMSLSSQFLFNRDSIQQSSKLWINGVMNPNCSARLCWDLLVIFIVLVDAMILPFQMAFQENDDLFLDIIWLVMSTTFFAMDMVVSFLTGYPAGKLDMEIPFGNIVTDKYRIARNYLRTWLLIDLVSTIPWGLFADLLTDGGNSGRSAQMAKLTKIIKFVRFLRLMRMLRLAKLAIIWERVEAKVGNLTLKQSVQLARVLLILTGICHWNACIWWMIGQPSSLFTDVLSEEAQQDYARQRHWATELRSDSAISGEGWTWQNRNRDDQYIFCFYWTLGVMRTMPSEVHPVNKVERLYVMFFMFFAFSAFAICVALITQTFFKFSERKRFFDDDIAAVRTYMRHINAPDHVQMAVKSFLQHLFARRKIVAKESSLMNTLPPSLSYMLKHSRLAPFLAELPVMRDLPEKAFIYVSEMAEVKDLAPGTCLIRKGRFVEAAFVVMSGRLAYCEDTHWDDVYDDLLQGQLSEEYMLQEIVVDGECLQHAHPMVSQRTLVATMSSEVMRIDRDTFFQLMLKHEDFTRTFNTHIIWGLEEGAVDHKLEFIDQEKAKCWRHNKRRSDGDTHTTIASVAAIL